MGYSLCLLFSFYIPMLAMRGCVERRLVCPLYIISHQCTSTGYGPEVTDSFCDPRGPTAPTSREQCGLFFDRGRAMFEDSVGVFICPSTSRGTSSSYRWVCGGFKAPLGAKAPTEFCCMRVPARLWWIQGFARGEGSDRVLLHEGTCSHFYLLADNRMH